MQSITHLAWGKVVMRRIALATSIPPRLVRNVDGREVGQEYQDRCVKSWIRAVFRILSANFADEIPILAERYPQVHFLPIERPESGWKAPSIRDLLRALVDQEEDIVGIINADILLDSNDWLNPIESAVHGAIVVGRRLDIDSLDLETHDAYLSGFDLFFFEREAIRDLSNRPFSIGKPWWDYYLPLLFRLRGLEVRLLVVPHAFHLKHPTAFDLPTWRFGVIGVCLGSITTQLLITFPTYLVLIPRLFRRLAGAKIEGGPQEIVFVDMSGTNDASLQG